MTHWKGSEIADHFGELTYFELGQLQNLHNSSSQEVWPTGSQLHPSGSEKLLPGTGTFTTGKRRHWLPRGSELELWVPTSGWKNVTKRREKSNSACSDQCAKCWSADKVLCYWPGDWTSVGNYHFQPHRDALPRFPGWQAMEQEPQSLRRKMHQELKHTSKDTKKQSP